MGSGAGRGANGSGIVAFAAAVIAVAGIVVMHGLPIPADGGSHHAMGMDRPAGHPSMPAMADLVSISSQGATAGPHHCISDGPRTLRMVLPPVTPNGPLLDRATLASPTLFARPAVAALSRASPSPDRLCISLE